MTLYLRWLHSCALSQELRVNSFEDVGPLLSSVSPSRAALLSWNDSGQRSLTKEMEFKELEDCL